MRLRVSSYARIREILGAAALERSVPDRATAGDVWRALARDFPALEALQASTRFVRNGAFVAEGAALEDGDELTLLPPFGGG